MTSHAKAIKTTKTVVLAVTLVVVCITVPIAIVLHFDWRAAATVAICAAMASIVSGVQAGWQVALRYVVLGLTASTVLAAMFPGNAWWGALILGVVAGLVGLSAQRGLSNALLMIPIALGFQIAQPPAISLAIPTPIFLGLLVLGTSGFATTVVYFVFRSHQAPKDLVKVSKHRAQYFAVVLGPFVAVATWCVVNFNLGHGGAWMILTILVIFKPFIQDGIKKSASRTIGTIAGFVVAIAIAQVTSSEAVFYTVGGVSLIAALTFVLLGHPYWQYAIALTIAIVMIEGATDLVSTAETRLIATLCGAAASLVLLLVLRPFVRKSAASAGLDHY